jgi:hypothetical protein
VSVSCDLQVYYQLTDVKVMWNNFDTYKPGDIAITTELGPANNFSSPYTLAYSTSIFAPGYIIHHLTPNTMIQNEVLI